MNITAGGYPVNWARVQLPLNGVWHADVRLDSDTTPSGQIELQLGDGSTVLQGFVMAAGPWNGLQLVRMCGGQAGQMGALVPAKAYRGVPLSIPLRDVANAAQEAISGSADGSLLTYQLSRWSFHQVPCGRALNGLLTAVPSGPSWRFNPDGTLWVGFKTWPDGGQQDYTVTHEQPDIGRMTLLTTAPVVLPGQQFMGRNIMRVEHLLTEETMATELYLQ